MGNTGTRSHYVSMPSATLFAKGCLDVSALSLNPCQNGVREMLCHQSSSQLGYVPSTERQQSSDGRTFRRSSDKIIAKAQRRQPHDRGQLFGCVLCLITSFVQ